MSNVRLGLVAAAAVAMLLETRVAMATADFPAAMATDLGGLACVPQCMVCHTNNSGGAGTVTQPFGLQMKAYGLVKYDQGSLANALTAMADASPPIDSNCNGTIDTDELKACADPNANTQCDGGASNLGDVVIYGCNASPSGPGTAVAAMALLIVVGGLLVRRLGATSKRRSA